MTVVLVTQEYKGRGGSLNTKNDLTDTKVFIALTDDEADDTYDVANSTLLPQRWDPHPTRDLLSVQTVSPKNFDADPLRWRVTVNYSNETEDQAEEDEDNPLSEPVKRQWRTVSHEVPATKDRDGTAILNKAGVPYDPPLMRTVRNSIMQFDMNEPTFDDATADSYVGALNSLTFAGKAPGKVRCNDITAVEEFKNGVSYWKVHYEFEYNRRGWQPEVLEMGYLERVSGGDCDGEFRRIKDCNDQELTEPVPIDAAGKPIKSGDLPAAAIYTTWNTEDEIDFNLLGLTV